MQTILLNSDSKSNIKLLTEMAKKIGVKVKILTEEEIEDMGLLTAMNQGRTNKTISSKEFVKSLRK